MGANRMKEISVGVVNALQRNAVALKLLKIVRIVMIIFVII
jgi:hypothetical protein